MAYTNNKTEDLNEYLRKNFSFTFGSLANLHTAFLEKKEITKEELDKTIQEIEQKAIEINYRLFLQTLPYPVFPEFEQKLVEDNEKNKRDKKIGRYNASDLYQIFTNKITPEIYLKPKEFTLEELRRMYWGTIIGWGIQKLFGYEEKKYEIKIDKEITLVCKTDLELDNEIIEFKTRAEIDKYDTLPPWYLHQCISYMKAKDLSKMRLYAFSWAFSGKLYEVEYDEKIWKEIVEKLTIFHQKVKQLWKMTLK